MQKCKEIFNPSNYNSKKKTGWDECVNSKTRWPKDDSKKLLSERGDNNDNVVKDSIDKIEPSTECSREKIFVSDEASNKITDHKNETPDSSQFRSIGKTIGNLLSCLSSKSNSTPSDSCKCGCNNSNINNKIDNIDDNDKKKSLNDSTDERSIKYFVSMSSKQSNKGICNNKNCNLSMKDKDLTKKDICDELELLYSLNCPKCGKQRDCTCRRQSSCACYPTIKPEKLQPSKNKDTKRLGEYMEINDANDVGLRGFKEYQIDDCGEIVKEVNEQLDEVVNKILKLDVNLKQLEESFIKTKGTSESKVCITKILEQKRSRIQSKDDKYSIIRSPSDPSILCIQPPKNEKYNLCDKKSKSRDCIRISTKENKFIVCGSCLKDDESMIDIVELLTDFITTKVYNPLKFNKKPEQRTQEPKNSLTKSKDNKQTNTDTKDKKTDVLQSTESEEQRTIPERSWIMSHCPIF